MTDTRTSDLPVGYRRGLLGEWLTLPWPDSAREKERLVASSLGPQVIDWAEWRTDEPGLLMMRVSVGSSLMGRPGF